MKIKIAKINEEKINAIMEKVHAGCTARCEDYDGIWRLSKNAEYHFRKHVEVSNLPGCKLRYLGNVSNSYKYTAMGDQIIIERGAKDWFLVNASREQCPNNSHSLEVHLEVSDRAKEAIEKRAVKNALRW